MAINFKGAHFPPEIILMGIRWYVAYPLSTIVLDMAKPFFAAVKVVFGDKVHVIDRFHVVQQAVSTLDEVLRSVQKQLEQEEAKDLKKLRKRWLKSADQLHVDELIARYVKRLTGCKT